MARKRSRGEGSIYHRKDGLWCAQITLPNGKRKTKYAKTQIGLRWSDVDLGKKSIHVNQVALTVYKKGVIISEPKTDRFEYALVAQWIERLTSDQMVVGSTPAEGTCANSKGRSDSSGFIFGMTHVIRSQRKRQYKPDRCSRTHINSAFLSVVVGKSLVL
jgi:hypothetical protein